MSAIEPTVSDWLGVTIEPHDRGGREFTLNGREIGHIHGERLLDLPFTKRIRDVLLDENRAEKHHVVPESGWVSYRIHTDEDVAGALWLLRVSYLYHLRVLRQQRQTQVAESIDVDRELSELGVIETVRRVVSSDE